jgi:hypothetical protein
MKADTRGQVGLPRKLGWPQRPGAVKLAGQKRGGQSSHCGPGSSEVGWLPAHQSRR